jgi:hypothetical protein
LESQTRNEYSIAGSASFFYSVFRRFNFQPNQCASTTIIPIADNRLCRLFPLLTTVYAESEYHSAEAATYMLLLLLFVAA